MDLQTIDYIIREYYQLLPKLETLALKHILHSEKLDAKADEKTRIQTRALMLRVGWLSDDEEVLLLMRDGVGAFRERIAKRIYAEHGGEALLNNCPTCHRLARTSRAKQCRFCGHDWH